MRWRWTDDAAGAELKPISFDTVSKGRTDCVAGISVRFESTEQPSVDTDKDNDNTTVRDDDEDNVPVDVQKKSFRCSHGRN
jgi:hypothetical protein